MTFKKPQITPKEFRKNKKKKKVARKSRRVNRKK